MELPEDFDGFAYREYLASPGLSAAIARARGPSPSSRRTVVGRPGRPWLVILLEETLHAGPRRARARARGRPGSRHPARGPLLYRARGRRRVRRRGPDPRRRNLRLEHRDPGHARRGAGPTARAGRGGRRSGLVVAVGHAAYVLLTCSSPSVVPAAPMAAAVLVARLGGSRAHATSALGLAALSCSSPPRRCCGMSGSSCRRWQPPASSGSGPSIESRSRAGRRAPGASRAHDGGTAHHPAGRPRQLRAPVARGAIANVLVVPLVPLVMPASAVAALARNTGGCDLARRGRRRDYPLARRRDGLARPPDHDRVSVNLIGIGAGSRHRRQHPKRVRNGLAPHSRPRHPGRCAR